MNERIKKILDAVKDKWKSFSTLIKVLIISIPIVLIAVIVVLIILFNRKDYVALFTGVESSEAGRIAQAVTELGVADVSVNGNGDIIVPENQADYLRMQLYMQGYGSSAINNYDIYNNGVSLWSTDSDKRELARQQTETRLGATIATLEQVRTATVNLRIGEKKDYVITDEKSQPTCSVTLTLRDDERLDNATIRAIYRLVETSVEDLSRENISIIDSTGNLYEWVSPEEDSNQDKSGVDIYKKRLEFEQSLTDILKEGMAEMLTKMYGEDGYAFNVTATLNYDAGSSTDTQYYPVDGTNAGVQSHVDQVYQSANETGEAGPVGVYNNGDISPDYPTYFAEQDINGFVYWKNEIEYKISNTVTTTEKDGYSIEAVTVALAVDQTNMTQAEREGLQELVAMAAGTSPANVSVFNMPFAIQGNTGTTVGSGNAPIIWNNQDSYRDLLLFIVIALGILLVALLILSLLVSRSRKKKIRRRQEAAIAAAQAGGFGAATSQESLTPEESDFNIASLTQEAAKESRETILKREITDFAKSNPEIVASIIRNMLREE